MGGIFLSQAEEAEIKALTEANISKALGRSVTFTMQHYPDGTRCDIKENRLVERHGFKSKPHVASFYVSQLPGCCGYMVSHWMNVNRPYRGRGIAQALQITKERIAKCSGYAYMMCTTTQHNQEQNHILAKHGWKTIHRGTNKRTKNQLVMWMKDVV